MRNILLILCSAITLTLFAGCKGDEPASTNSATLTLEKSVVDVTADGGEFEVAYTLKNGTEGAELKYNVEKSWVHDVDTSVSGVISFKVDANYETNERKCRVELIYPGVYPNQTITIKQAIGKEHSIKLELVKAAATSITMNVIPQDKNMPYIFILGTGKYFEENNGELMHSDEALWASDMDIFESFGSMFGGDASTGAAAFLYSGDLMGHQFTGVTPGTTYVAYAYGFDKETLKPLTEISRLKITTTTVNDYTLHFDFNVEVDGPNVVIDIAPQGYDGYYYYGVFWAKDVEGATPEQLREYCEETWESEKGYYSSFFDSPEEGLHFIFNELAFRGPQHLETELDANTEFILWAFGMDDEALLNTTPEFYSFKTGDVTASDNTFTVTITDLMPRKATVNVETANNDPYVAAILRAESLEGLDDDDAVEYILANLRVTSINGSMSDTATSLSPNTTYEVLVFGYSAGCPTTKATRISFTTPDAIMAELDFSLNVSKYYDGSAVAALNTAWEGAKGYVIVPVEAAVDADAVNYYFSVMYSSDIYYFGYEQLINVLVGEGPADEGVAYVLEYDNDFTFFGVAEDTNGNFTEMWKSKDMRFTPEGCSPAEEFVNSTAKSSATTPKSASLHSESGLLSL